MESRLLTDEDIVFELFFHAKANMSEIDVIKIAQDALTHRIDCESLTTWLDEPCIDIEHGIGHADRNDCPFCLEEMTNGFRKGRMPGETE